MACRDMYAAPTLFRRRRAAVDGFSRRMMYYSAPPPAAFSAMCRHELPQLFDFSPRFSAEIRLTAGQAQPQFDAPFYCMLPCHTLHEYWTDLFHSSNTANTGTVQCDMQQTQNICFRVEGRVSTNTAEASGQPPHHENRSANVRINVPNNSHFSNILRHFYYQASIGTNFSRIIPAISSPHLRRSQKIAAIRRSRGRRRLSQYTHAAFEFRHGHVIAAAAASAAATRQEMFCLLQNISAVRRRSAAATTFPAVRPPPRRRNDEIPPSRDIEKLRIFPAFNRISPFSRLPTEIANTAAVTAIEY